MIAWLSVRRWVVLMLPYIEGNTFYEQLDLNQATSNNVKGAAPGNYTATAPLAGDAVTSGNAEIVSKRVSTFSCPSDIGDPLLPAGAHYGIGNTPLQGVKTNYDFSVLQDWACDAWRLQAHTIRFVTQYTVSPPLLPARPMFGENSDTTISMVEDGTTHTVAMIETLYDVEIGESLAWGYRGWIMQGVDLPTNFINSWLAPYVQDPRPSKLRATGYAGSLHPGGVHFLMADSSVHFVSEDMDAITQDLLSRMADSRQVDLP